MTAHDLGRALRTPQVARLGWMARICIVGMLICLGSPHALWAQPPLPPVVEEYTSTAPSESPRISVVIELASPPAIEAWLDAQSIAAAGGDEIAATAAMAAAAQLQLAAVETEQTQVIAALAQLDPAMTELYRTQRVYNGLGVLLDAEVAADLAENPAALAQVVAVHPLIPKSPAQFDRLETTAPFETALPDTLAGVPQIGAPALWSAPEIPGGLTGAGVRVAVIDTGIDYLHRHFGGPGSGYAANDSRLIGDVPNFPGPKIAGGWDFAGDAYNADPEAPSYAPIPTPDPDPMDCYIPGHGTHVAGIIGGYGVTADGRTYGGPYQPNLPAANFGLGPGVAPHTELYALKVFGCEGKTALVDAAIEWAVDPNRDGDFSDRMDIVNLSLGSSFGAPYDATAVAVNNAARLGIVMVASAGNSGDTAFAVGAPGIAEAGISVAATRLVEPACAAPPCALVELLADFSARGPRRGDVLLKPDVAAPGFDIRSARAGSGNGALSLSGTSMAAPHVAGAAALLLQEMRLSPTFLPQTEDPDLPGYLLWQPGDIKARLMNTAQQQILPASTATKPVHSPLRMGTGRIDLEPAHATQVVAYSAETPSAVSISFGAPTVIDRLYQTRNAELANRGSTPITFTVSYSAVLPAHGITVTVGAPPPTATNTITPTLAYTITVPPYGTATVPVHLEVDAAALVYPRDPVLSESGQFPRHWLGESTGQLLFTPIVPESGDPESGDPESGDPESNADQTGVQPSLIVSVYAAPQPAAALHALPPALDFGNALTATRTLQLVGTPLRGTALPGDPVSLASVVELHYISNRRATLGGLPSATFEHADLRYVGAAVMPVNQRVEMLAQPAQIHDTDRTDPLLYFGIATHGPWSTLNEVEFNVWIDTTGDGRANYRLYNSDLNSYSVGLWSETRGGDIFITALEDLATGDRYLADFVNGVSAASHTGHVYNTQVVILPLPLHMLDLDPDRPTLRYRVTTYSRTFGNHPLLSPVVDATPWQRIQITPPALTLSAEPLSGARESPLFIAGTTTRLQVDYAVRDYILTRPQALMLFHHHNRPEAQVEIIPLHYRLPFEYYLPSVSFQMPYTGQD